MEIDRQEPHRDAPRGFVRAAMGDLARIGVISRVLFRHGFGDLVDREALQKGDAGGGVRWQMPGETVRRFRAVLQDPADAARRMRMVLEELGPTFVKVGQILSTRSDLMPPEFVAELAHLQDHVPVVPFEQVRAVIEGELARPLEEAFGSFDPTPLASASIAQTHRATLLGGTPVVVKVQRPGIAETIRSDMALLQGLARLLEATFTEMEFYSPVGIVHAIEEGLRQELDFREEAAHLEEFRDLFSEDSEILIPAIYRSHCSRSVLTMDFVDGTRMADVVTDSPEAHTLALRLIDSFYRQVFVFGRFHGDPHPGNLLVVGSAEGSKLAFLDFGLCGTLSSLQRDQLVTLVVAVLTGDIDGTARMLLRMGRPLGPVDVHTFKMEVASIRERHFKRRLHQIDMSGFLREAFSAAQRYRIRIAPEYSVLSKAAVTVEGVVRALAPSLDLHEHIRPYGTRLLQDHYSPDRLTKSAIAGTVHLANFLREVPEQLGQVLMDLESGRLSVQVQSPGLAGLGTDLNRQTTRLFMGVVCAALTIAAPLWHAHDPIRIWGGRIPLMTTLCLLTAVSLAFWGLAAHIGAVRRDRKVRLSSLLRWFGR